MRYFSKELQLPTKEEMLKDTNDEMEKRWAQGYKKRQAHMMGQHQVSQDWLIFVLNKKSCEK